MLENEFNEDALQFWVEVEAYRILSDDETSKRVETMKRIYMTFISMRGERQINITPDIRQAIIAQVKQGSPSSTLFDDARNWLVKLMKSTTFPHFLQSKHYRKMVSLLNQLEPTEASLMYESQVTPSSSSSSLSSSLVNFPDTHDIERVTKVNTGVELDDLASELRKMHADLLQPIELKPSPSPSSEESSIAPPGSSPSSSTAEAQSPASAPAPETAPATKSDTTDSPKATRSSSGKKKDKRRDAKDKLKSKSEEKEKKVKTNGIANPTVASSQPEDLSGSHQKEWQSILSEVQL